MSWFFARHIEPIECIEPAIYGLHELQLYEMIISIAKPMALKVHFIQFHTHSFFSSHCTGRQATHQLMIMGIGRSSNFMRWYSPSQCPQWNKEALISAVHVTKTGIDEWFIEAVMLLEMEWDEWLWFVDYLYLDCKFRNIVKTGLTTWLQLRYFLFCPYPFGWMS